ncbi:expressed unknown protein [Seminavis robusta]|uniref:Uncharacterized protein n=1 Tax=Seminavis robusta TaxID=568900 RepID=A0A9N8EQA7_9STRA|nr:expressed unknown protein [Seminavis robusta]|eukprot:Sro1766_g296220.1 n/a (425) ;mRNA; f:6573-7931
MQVRGQTQRKMPQRSRSFHMKEFFNQSFPFRYSKLGNHARDEQNIFCADILSTDFIIDKLMEVRNNTEVVKLEVEDLLTSSHHALLPLIKALVVSGKRDWQSIKFVDAVESDLFALWQQQKQAIMQDYEESIDDNSKFNEVVSFDATITIAQGTPSYVLRDILQSLRQGKDKTISNVSFDGSFVGVDKAVVPTLLKKNIDPVSGETTEEVTISVLSGWSKSSALDWKILLNACVGQLQQPTDAAATANPGPPLRRAESAQGPIVRPQSQAPKASNAKAPLRRSRTLEGRPRLPRRMNSNRSLRRTKSANESTSPPTGSQRSASMPLHKRKTRRGGANSEEGRSSQERRSRRQRLSEHRTARQPSNHRRPRRKSNDALSQSGHIVRPRSLPPQSSHSFPSPMFAESPDYDWTIGVYLNTRAPNAA